MKRNDNESIAVARKNIDMNNLKVLIDKNNFTVTKVAMNVGVSDSSIYEYMRNTAFPSLPVLINIANFFKCNLDYLVGRTNNPSLYDNFKTEEIKAIILMLETLTEEERQFFNSLLLEISKKKNNVKS